MDVGAPAYRQLIAQAIDAILVCDRGQVLVANTAAHELFARDPVGASLAALFTARSTADLEARLAASHPAAAGRQRLEASRPDGSRRDVEATVAVLAPPDLVQLTLRDITDELRALADLRAREERFSLAMLGAQVGVYDWNLESGAVIYSSRWKEMLGYRDDEIEPHVRSWERLIHPEDKPRALAATGRVIQGDDNYLVECRLRHKAGHYIHVLSRGYPVRRPGDHAVVRIVGTHLDLTERKQAELALRESEERLSLAFAGAQEGVWDWNLETGAVVYSHQWKAMLGYGADDIEPWVSAWERLLHPDDRAKAAALNDQVQSGSPSYEGEFRLRHKDGHYVHVWSRGLPIRREPGGPVVRIVGTHLDLSDRIEAEAALRRAHEALEQRVRERTAELATANASLTREMDERQRAERARTELLGRLVFAQEDERRRIAREMHDQFGEHLTALGRAVEHLAARSTDDPEWAAAVAALDRVNQRLDRDVEHLVWQLRPTALDDLGLRAALANYARDWSGRVGLSVQMHSTGLLDDRLPPHVETTLYRIAQEALTNIAKHAKATEVQIVLERRGATVVLSIEDNGVGFDPDNEPALVDVTQPRSFGLLGMHERAALIGATLNIESSPGHGTTVLLRMSADVPSAPNHG